MGVAQNCSLDGTRVVTRSAARPAFTRTSIRTCGLRNAAGPMLLTVSTAGIVRLDASRDGGKGTASIMCAISTVKLSCKVCGRFVVESVAGLV